MRISPSFSRSYPTLPDFDEPAPTSQPVSASSSESSAMDPHINAELSQHKMNSEYLKAAMEGDLNSVCAFLKHCTFPTQSHGAALWHAASGGHLLVIKELLHWNTCSPEWKTEAVWILANNNHFDIIAHLLKCKLIEPKDLISAIRTCAMRGHLSGLAALLEAGEMPKKEKEAALLEILKTPPEQQCTLPDIVYALLLNGPVSRAVLDDAINITDENQSLTDEVREKILERLGPARLKSSLAAGKVAQTDREELLLKSVARGYRQPDVLPDIVKALLFKTTFSEETLKGAIRRTQRNNTLTADEKDLTLKYLEKAR